MIFKKILAALALLFISGASIKAADTSIEGQMDYQINCMACHLIDARGVGPSLVKIAETYPEDKAWDFVLWAQSPGKKDPKMIQMPSMAHVPSDTLERIHSYILQVTEGKEEQRGRYRFPPFAEPNRELPYVVRAFLPDASPASFAVILKNNISICWDTEACRLRYAWKGSETKPKARRNPADLPAPFYNENGKSLWSFGSKEKTQFLGYRLIDKYPEFNYMIGDIEIREKVSNGTSPGSIVRNFSLQGVNEPISLNLSHLGEVTISSNKGKLDENYLHLSALQAKSFSLTISQQ